MSNIVELSVCGSGSALIGSKTYICEDQVAGQQTARVSKEGRLHPAPCIFLDWFERPTLLRAPRTRPARTDRTRYLLLRKNIRRIERGHFPELTAAVT